MDAGADDFVSQTTESKDFNEASANIDSTKTSNKGKQSIVKELETYISETINKVQTETSHPSEQIEAAILAAT